MRLTFFLARTVLKRNPKIPVTFFSFFAVSFFSFVSHSCMGYTKVRTQSLQEVKFWGPRSAACARACCSCPATATGTSPSLKPSAGSGSKTFQFAQNRRTNFREFKIFIHQDTVLCDSWLVPLQDVSMVSSPVRSAQRDMLSVPQERIRFFQKSG
jgi:hypothetical protein